MILSYIRKNPRSVLQGSLQTQSSRCCIMELWDAAVKCPMDIFSWICVQMDHQAAHPLRKMLGENWMRRKSREMELRHREEELKIQRKQTFTDYF